MTFGAAGDTTVVRTFPYGVPEGADSLVRLSFGADDTVRHVPGRLLPTDSLPEPVSPVLPADTVSAADIYGPVSFVPVAGAPEPCGIPVTFGVGYQMLTVLLLLLYLLLVFRAGGHAGAARRHGGTVSGLACRRETYLQHGIHPDALRQASLVVRFHDRDRNACGVACGSLRRCVGRCSGRLVCGRNRRSLSALCRTLLFVVYRPKSFDFALDFVPLRRRSDAVRHICGRPVQELAGIDAVELKQV